LRIAESYWRKAIATLSVAAIFVSLYEIQTRDSKSEASVTTVIETGVLPQAGARLQFSATAYCKGETTVMDTGPAVRGRLVDLYLWSCKEALQFGRRNVRLTVLRLGWSPENSLPGMVDTLFRKREAESKKVVPPPPPPATLPSSDATR
jgi:3D (Asp-Asp-Asp) domain-containing protein